jgi:hypothetical protein
MESEARIEKYGHVILHKPSIFPEHRFPISWDVLETPELGERRLLSSNPEWIHYLEHLKG